MLLSVSNSRFTGLLLLEANFWDTISSTLLNLDFIHECVSSLYLSIVVEEGVNGELLGELEEEDLKELGVGSSLHRRKLMLVAKKLKNGESISTFLTEKKSNSNHFLCDDTKC